MRHIFTREFYEPRESQGRTNIETIKKYDAIVYTYTCKSANGEKPGAMGFHGKAAKPDWHFSFRSIESRDEHIAKYFEGRQARADYMAKQKAERTKPHTLKVGDILYTSWGYDQTNIDFYQVTKVPGASTVEIREIAASSTAETGFMTAECTAVKDKFTGEPMIKRASSSNSVKIASYAHAYPWDGKPKRYSWYA